MMLWLAAIAGLLVLVGIDARPKGAPEVIELPSGPPADIREELARSGLPLEAQQFLLATAWTESNWQVGASNPSPSEAAAAKTGYERALKSGPLPFPASRYTWGSGGWFGLLPSSAVAGARNLDPMVAVFDPRESIRSATRYMQRIRGWDQWLRSDRSWKVMRRAWKNPSTMDQPMPATDERFLSALKKAGLPASFADRKVVL